MLLNRQVVWNVENTARTFFDEFEKTAEITELGKELTKRFEIIMQVVCCDETIIAETFGNFALEIAKGCVSKYIWYYMPAFVHRLLIHGKN